MSSSREEKKCNRDEEDVDIISDSDLSSDSDSDMQLDPTLNNILSQKSLRWIFVGGKGGVGKTTTACSLSTLLAADRAKSNEKVLLISTDPAHNLSDAFGQQFGAKPCQVNGISNLYAMEVDPKIDMSQFGDEFMQSVQSSTANFLSEIASSVPGIDEAMSFAELIKQVKKKDFAVIVFDTAPTGHTIRLLSFPGIIEKALIKMDALRNRFGGMFSNFASLLTAQSNTNASQMDTNAISAKLSEMKLLVEQIKQQFEDSSLTTFVCVSIPEFLSLYETERLVQKLAQFGIDTHNIVINQVLIMDENECTQCKRCKTRVKMQEKYITQFEDLYPDFHLIKVPLLFEEVRQLPKLRKFADLLINTDEDHTNTNTN